MLWTSYSEFRRGQISPSTYKRDYLKMQRRLQKLSIQAPYLETAIEIRDWFIQHYAAETARRSLMQINACCNWAYESDMIQTNVFKGVHRHIRKARQSEKAWAAFTVEERDRIIQAFDVECPFYAPWVKFLFWTGCRPEEAAALRWEHVANDCTELLIIEAEPVDTREVQGTKNGRTTRFPCNARLQRLLREVRPANYNRGDRVFTGVKGGPFDYHNFQTRFWRPLIKRLVSDGKVAFYLSQYHTRHTWITLALEHLAVADVSYLARVSTNVLYAHYAGRSRRIVVPEF
ncbi:site-specific integrase [Leptolyngbya sp. AN02str]|uniref:site-specific integrase n=1 Tax=Leptolyngbya sp. AN02str TaxID=3423363 RepID=UPI003D313F3D